MTMQPKAALLLRAAMLAASLASLPAAQAAVEPGFGLPMPADANAVVMRSEYITMPDGTRLAADIYRPARNGVPIEGKFPVILHASAQRFRLETDNRSGAGRFSTQMTKLANHGYVFVVFERRGMGASFGVRRGYHDRTEARDAYDMTEWAAHQPWSTGKIGVYGCSNTGDAAMHFLTNPAPQLTAVFAGCFNWDKYSGGMRGGVLANWGTGPQSSVEQDFKTATPVDGDEQKVLLRQATQQHAASTNLLALWSGMPYRDSVSPLTGTAFWQEGSIGTYVDKVRASKVPVYVQGGWLDDFRTQGFITLANLNQPAKLIIGPWGHCLAGDFSMTSEALRWFDHWLKGTENGIMKEAKYHYTTMNTRKGDEWRASEVWPPARARPQAVYLGEPSSRTGLAQNDHALLPTAPHARNASVSFQVDYKVSCAKGTGLGPTCPQDDKGLTFSSAPLKNDLELTGFPVADLWVASSATDGPLFAYLEDVAPDGSITMVSEGRLRASLRTLNPAPYKLPAGLPWHGFYRADAKPLVPGKPVELVFDLQPVSYVFQAGHRYRVTLTGADPREKLRKEVSPPPTWTILFDAAHPSKITLPMVDAGVKHG